MRRSEFQKHMAPQDAPKLRVGIAVARFNEDVTNALLAGALDVLGAWKVKEKNIHIIRTHGSFELPFAAQQLIQKHKVHAVIALGCLIKGETKHDEYIAGAVFHGLTTVSIERGVPVGLGVLTTNDLPQAIARSRGEANHGARAAEAALDLACATRSHDQ